MIDLIEKSEKLYYNLENVNYNRLFILPHIYKYCISDQKKKYTNKSKNICKTVKYVKIYLWIQNTIWVFGNL